MKVKAMELIKAMTEYAEGLNNGQSVGVICNAYTGEVKVVDNATYAIRKGDFGVNRAFRRNSYEWSAKTYIEGLAIVNDTVRQVRESNMATEQFNRVSKITLAVSGVLLALLVAFAMSTGVLAQKSTKAPTEALESVTEGTGSTEHEYRARLLRVMAIEYDVMRDVNDMPLAYVYFMDVGGNYFRMISFDTDIYIGDYYTAVFDVTGCTYTSEWELQSLSYERPDLFDDITVNESEEVY